MYDRILVPTDGSKTAIAALDRAIDLAKHYDADIYTVYVIEPFYTPDFQSEQVMDSLEREGERAVADVEDRVEEAGLNAVSEVRVGTPHREILDIVEDYAVDMVVMGTHGRTGLDHYLLGSVTEKVVRLCDVPVLTVRAPPNAD